MVNYTLFDLAEHIRQVLALNFAEAIWIQAELSNCNLSRGHYYLDLVQKAPDSDEPIAQASAILWAQDYRRLQRPPDMNLELLLQSGLELRMKVRVDFHERYGLKLQITDIDPAFTLGQLDLERRKTLLTLKQLHLLERNASLNLPSVLQRIAILSSENAAGYQDFIKQLTQNPWGYAFECSLFPCAVQGRNAGPEIVNALQIIQSNPDWFDAVVIVRGGGAKLDLAVFDGLELAKAVANMPLPVLSGIGHDTDETVLDVVSHRALKTPTAVAEFILQHNFKFENALLLSAEYIGRVGQMQVRNHTIELDHLENQLHFTQRERMQHARNQLDNLSLQIPRAAQQLLRMRQLQLDQHSAICSALNPETVLKRGYSLSLKEGKILRSAEELQVGDTVETRFADGSVQSVVSIPTSPKKTKS